MSCPGHVARPTRFVCRADEPSHALVKPRCVARHMPAAAGFAMVEQVTAWSGPPHRREGTPCRTRRHCRDQEPDESPTGANRSQPPGRGETNMHREDGSVSRPHLARAVGCELEHQATILPTVITVDGSWPRIRPRPIPEDIRTSVDWSTFRPLPNAGKSRSRHEKRQFAEPRNWLSAVQAESASGCSSSVVGETASPTGPWIRIAR